jgi:hypothetical protein
MQTTSYQPVYGKRTAYRRCGQERVARASVWALCTLAVAAVVVSSAWMIWNHCAVDAADSRRDCLVPGNQIDTRTISVPERPMDMEEVRNSIISRAWSVLGSDTDVVRLWSDDLRLWTWPDEDHGRAAWVAYEVPVYGCAFGIQGNHDAEELCRKRGANDRIHRFIERELTRMSLQGICDETASVPRSGVKTPPGIRGEAPVTDGE